MTDALDLYFRDLNRDPQGTGGLSPEEERRLGRKAHKGNIDAQQALARANQQFAVSTAKEYQGRGLPLEDLIQQANVGLMVAAREFDPTRGVKFITYAVWWIRAEIIDALSDQQNQTRIPSSTRNKVSEYWERVEEYRGQGYSEREAQVRARNDFSPRTRTTIEQVLHATNEVSLDAPVDDEDDRPREALTSNESAGYAAVWRRQRRDDLDAALDRAITDGAIDPRDRNILYLYYGLLDGEGHTLKEIGGLLGVTRERVRQVRNEALENLKPYLQPPEAA